MRGSRKLLESVVWVLLVVDLAMAAVLMVVLVGALVAMAMVAAVSCVCRGGGVELPLVQESVSGYYGSVSGCSWAVPGLICGRCGDVKLLVQQAVWQWPGGRGCWGGKGCGDGKGCSGKSALPVLMALVLAVVVVKLRRC